MKYFLKFKIMSFRNLKIFLLKNKIKINLIKKYCAGLASKMTSFKSWCPIDPEIPINCAGWIYCIQTKEKSRNIKYVLWSGSQSASLVKFKGKKFFLDLVYCTWSSFTMALLSDFTITIWEIISSDGKLDS